MSAKSKKDEKVQKEEDCACYADNRTKKACPPTQNVTHPLRYYEFTQEEMKALEECDKESFYKRCLPFSTLFATITYAAIKAVPLLPVPIYFYEYFLILGYLKRNPHFGVFPKVMFAAMLGYFYGRFSYLSICDKKLRKQLSEDSHLGKVLRKYYLENNPPATSIKK